MTAYTDQIPTTSDHLSKFDRVKVDPGQTSFFEGREFRAYRELNLAAGATLVIKAVVPNNMILTALSLELESGQMRVATVSGGTPAGTFAEVIPIFNRNNMTVGNDRRAAITPQVVLTAGGTHTGGIELDVLRVRTVTNQGTSHSSTVGASTGDERGVAPGTYHWRLVAAAGDPCVGVFRASWEERQPIP